MIGDPHFNDGIEDLGLAFLYVMSTVAIVGWAIWFVGLWCICDWIWRLFA